MLLDIHIVVDLNFRIVKSNQQRVIMSTVSSEAHADTIKVYLSGVTVKNKKSDTFCKMPVADKYSMGVPVQYVTMTILAISLCFLPWG